MIVERLYPQSVTELTDMVHSRTRSASCVAVQAGHFLVYYDHTEDQLLPCIASELSGPRYEVIRSEVGYFPLSTWEIGVNMLMSLPVSQKHVLVLVNDWQYLPKGIDRGRFYQKYHRLPPVYRGVLLSTGSSVKLLSPPRLRKALFTGDFFSEQTLRNQYGKHAKRLISRKELPSNAELEFNGEALSCNLVDALGRRQQVYCDGKSENCTHEVAELIFSVTTQTHCDTFINFYPLVCKEYVEAGTELSFNLFHTPVELVMNIGMIASGVLSKTQLVSSTVVSVHSQVKRERS